MSNDEIDEVMHVAESLRARLVTLYKRASKQNSVAAIIIYGLIAPATNLKDRLEELAQVLGEQERAHD